MEDTQAAIIEVSESTVTRYVEAHQTLQQQLGRSPGPEFLMALAVEREDPEELIEVFSDLIVEELHQPAT